MQNLEVEEKKKNALEQLELLGPRRVGKPLYSPETIVRAFQYFATSRALYNRLSNDHKYPHARTLTRITSKTSKKSEATFINDVLAKVDANQRQCILMLDEVYVLKALLYHGGSFFGKALNKPDELATTILSFMMKCINGGPEFIAKM